MANKNENQWENRDNKPCKCGELLLRNGVPVIWIQQHVRATHRSQREEHTLTKCENQLNEEKK